MKRFLICILACLGLAGCANENVATQDVKSGEEKQYEIVLTRGEQQANDITSAFAFNFYRAANAVTSESNLIVSPLNALMALSMNANGEKGDFREMLLASIYPNGTFEDLNSYHFKMIEGLPQLSEDVEMVIANSLWASDNYPLNDTTYVELLQKNYKCDIHQDEVLSVSKVNNWINEYTNGKIKGYYPSGFEFSNAMVLASVLSFNGKWVNSFDKKKTQRSAFTQIDGSKSEVSYLTSESYDVQFYQDKELTIVDLPFKGGFQMQFLLPNEGVAIDDCMQNLTFEQWNTWTSQSKKGVANLMIPKFSITSANDPKELVKSFELDNGRILWDITNACTMSIDEEGVTATASSEQSHRIVTEAPTAPITFHATRPFGFILRAKATNTILFVGKVGQL